MSQDLFDSGYVGRQVSLAGVLGRDGLGMRVWSSTPAPSTDSIQILGSNPSRVFAEITNEGTVDVQIAFDQSFGNGYHTLVPRGSMLINRDFPWTGGVYARTLAGTGLLGVDSGSVQQ